MHLASLFRGQILILESSINTCRIKETKDKILFTWFHVRSRGLRPGWEASLDSTLLTSMRGHRAPTPEVASGSLTDSEQWSTSRRRTEANFLLEVKSYLLPRSKRSQVWSARSLLGSLESLRREQMSCWPGAKPFPLTWAFRKGASW